MIAILSPARTIRSATLEGFTPTRPASLDHTRRLAAILASYSAWELESILRCSPRLALQASASFQAFDPQEPGSPALLAYQGIAYANVGPTDFTPEDLAFAGEHLRILSAFYGVLRPGDGILPYRLELVSRLRVDGGNLYRFWGERYHREIFCTGQPVINLCSAEYAKAVTPFLQARDRFITCRFLERAGGKLRCRATAAKAARGRMARFLIKNRLTRPEQLRDFCWEDYAFAPDLSGREVYTFVR